MRVGETLDGWENLFYQALQRLRAFEAAAAWKEEQTAEHSGALACLLARRKGADGGNGKGSGGSNRTGIDGGKSGGSMSV